MPFSDTQRHGFPCLCYWVSLCFVVLNKLKCTVNKFLPQKKRQSPAVLQCVCYSGFTFAARNLPFSETKRHGFPCLCYWVSLCFVVLNKLKCTVNKFLPQKKRQSPAVLQWVAIRVSRLQHATCRFRGLLPHRT